MNDYCSVIKNIISISIVDPSKYSLFLLQKQLHDEVYLDSEDNINILDDEAVVTEELPRR